jgi:hypothetical protein
MWRARQVISEYNASLHLDEDGFANISSVPGTTTHHTRASSSSWSLVGRSAYAVPHTIV